MLRLLLLSCCLRIALLADPPCVIELECSECLPEHMPLVSAAASDGTVVLAAGDEVTLSCGAGRLLAYPLSSSLVVVCEAGRYRSRMDGSLRSLLELGCQADVFEDVLHPVARCTAPLQGRAYTLADTEGTRHLSALCFDEDRGVAARAHFARPLRLPPHSDTHGPLSLLGNFNQMFDASTRRQAEMLYANDARMTKRLHEQLKHERVSWGGQTLTSAKLLSALYFEEQLVRVSEFVSNKVPTWASVARGNWQHLQEDVARLLRARVGAIEVHAGTHGAGRVRTAGAAVPLQLAADRFPVPRYLWTVAVDRRRRQALAVVVLNDPFVAVSEVRAAVFCESECSRAPWLHALRRHRNYETPVLGLAFCCRVRNFTALVGEMPAELLADIPDGEDGLLTTL